LLLPFNVPSSTVVAVQCYIVGLILNKKETKNSQTHLQQCFSSALLSDLANCKGQLTTET
jgi:hypothetical protein